MIDCMTCLVILGRGCPCVSTHVTNGVTHGFVEANFSNGCIEKSSDPDPDFQKLNTSGLPFRLCELNEYEGPPEGMLTWGARVCGEVLFVKATHASR